MAVNHNPIREVTAEDIGSEVSYQAAGMTKPEYGRINGLSYISGMVFVKFEGDANGKLTDLYNLRWCRCNPWLDERGRAIDRPD